MTAIRVHTNAPQVREALRVVGRTAPVKAARITRHYGALLTTSIKAHAAGRPGPRRVTGDYARSWTTTFGLDPRGVPISVSSTDKPEAARLENGYVGVDSLGRHYRQPPYRHVAPAVTLIEPAYHEALRAMAGAL